MRRTILAMAAMSMASLAACGGDDGASVDDAEVTAVAGETTTTDADGDGEAIDSDDDEAAGGAADPCALVSEELLASVFSDVDIDVDDNNLGAGFAECTWEAGDSELVVSIVPAANYQSDYIDQLNVGAPIDSAVLGPEAVEFPGLVGIGRASSKGSTVGFTAGDLGALVAVRTGEDGAPDTDLPLAVDIAEVVATQL